MGNTIATQLLIRETILRLFRYNGVNTYTIVILGDINGDSAADGFDVSYLDLYLNGYRHFVGAYLEACDVNQDGLVDINDYNKLKRWAVEDYG